MLPRYLRMPGSATSAQRRYGRKHVSRWEGIWYHWAAMKLRRLLCSQSSSQAMLSRIAAVDRQVTVQVVLGRILAENLSGATFLSRPIL